MNPSLNILLNIVVIWNTVYLQKAIEYKRATPICNLYFYSLHCGYYKSPPIQSCTFLQPILSDKIVILFLMRFFDAANTNFNHIFFEISYLSFLKQVQPREIIVKLWKETLSL